MKLVFLHQRQETEISKIKLRAKFYFKKESERRNKQKQNKRKKTLSKVRGKKLNKFEKIVALETPCGNILSSSKDNFFILFHCFDENF